MAGRLGLMVRLYMQGDPVCITSSSDGRQQSENLGKAECVKVGALRTRSLHSRCLFAKTRREAKGGEVQPWVGWLNKFSECW
jgi:hypothetical protein